jgi:hypothetical protein
MGEPGKPMAETSSTHVFKHLSSSEQNMLLELLLASGSLKELAKEYGVSYPTIRARLDRLIQRVQELQQQTAPDPLAHKLADLIEQGQISAAAAHDVLEMHRKLIQFTSVHQEPQA